MCLFFYLDSRKESAGSAAHAGWKAFTCCRDVVSEVQSLSIKRFSFAFISLGSTEFVNFTKHGLEHWTQLWRVKYCNMHLTSHLSILHIDVSCCAKKPFAKRKPHKWIIVGIENDLLEHKVMPNQVERVKLILPCILVRETNLQSKQGKK